MSKKVSELQEIINPGDEDLTLISDINLTGNASKALSFANLWSWVLDKFTTASPVVSGLNVSDLSGVGTRFVTVDSAGNLSDYNSGAGCVPIASALVEFNDNTTELVAIGSSSERMIFINYLLETVSGSQVQGGQLYVLRDGTDVYVRDEFVFGTLPVSDVSISAQHSGGTTLLELAALGVGENVRFRWQKTASIES